MNDDGASETISTSSGSTVVASTDSVIAKIPESTAAPLNSLGFGRRQDASQPIAMTSASFVLSPSSLAFTSSSTGADASATPTVITFPTTNGPPIQQIGQYNCTSLMRLDLLTGILEQFLDATSTTTGAALLLLTVDVHAASSILNPNAPAPKLSSNQLPATGSLLSDVLKGNLSSTTYTPLLLQEQRANLNTSWYNVNEANQPVDGFYDVLYNSQGNRYTVDGWPTEAYVEFQKFHRLAIGYGAVDSQMSLYNIGPDLDFMFPPGTFSDTRTTSLASSGQVLSGCLFDASDAGVTSQRNSSWAVTTTPSLDISAEADLMAPIPVVSNLTSCGLTAFLNETLGGQTADKNPLPYAAYAHSTLWSWAPGEPLNATSQSDDSGKRCAVMTTSPYLGRWRVTNCDDRYRVACHHPGQPYSWKISSDTSDYYGAPSKCDSPYEFGVPHTALENSHLLAALQDDDRKAPDEAIFVDLNSINVPECWVSGPDGTCPYLSTETNDRIRIVVVPTVAAVIIFVLAALTFFVKCAANRRENKRGRRRRLMGGWEYEGVPS
jgi:hypothetical protein